MSESDIERETGERQAERERERGGEREKRMHRIQFICKRRIRQ